MPVVINEFEVAPAPAAAPAPPAAGPGDQSAERPEPRQIADLLRQELERLARVWAH
jgi:hypothetical protein